MNNLMKIRAIATITVLAFLFTQTGISYALREYNAGEDHRARGIGDEIRGVPVIAASAGRHTVTITALTSLSVKEKPAVQQMQELSTNLAAFSVMYDRLANLVKNRDTYLTDYAFPIMQQLLEGQDPQPLTTYMARFEDLLTYLQELGHLDLLDTNTVKEALRMGTENYEIVYVPDRTNVALDTLRLVPATARADGETRAQRLKKQKQEEQKKENKAIAEVFGFNPACFGSDGNLKQTITFEGTRCSFTDVRYLPDSEGVILAYTSRPGAKPGTFSLDVVVDTAGAERIFPADEKYKVIRTAEEARKIAERVTADAKGKAKKIGPNNYGIPENYDVLSASQAKPIIANAKKFKTDVELKNCMVVVDPYGRINKTFFIIDKDADRVFVYQDLGDFFDPEAIEYQIVSVEMAENIVHNHPDPNVRKKFEQMVPLKYCNLVDSKLRELEGRKQLYKKDQTGNIVRVVRVMEFSDAKFFQDFDEIPPKYRALAAQRAAYGIKLFDELLTYIPEGRALDKEPLPDYHNTVKHVKEVRRLLGLSKRKIQQLLSLPVEDWPALRQPRGTAEVLPSRRDRVRKARMIPGLLIQNPHNKYREQRDRILQLIAIIMELTSNPDGSIGLLANDYDGPLPEKFSKKRMADCDPKGNNLGWEVDPVTGEPLHVKVVIDRDTIQLEGMRFIDFADAVQFIINPAGENPWTKGLPLTSVTVKKAIFENFMKGFLKGEDKATKKALRPHLIWATAKIACELVMRFAKAGWSEYADVDPNDSDYATKIRRGGVYFGLKEDTPIDSQGTPLLNTKENLSRPEDEQLADDTNLRLALARMRVACLLLTMYGEELGIDPAKLARIKALTPTEGGWESVAPATGVNFKSILVVEDEVAVRQVLEMIIKIWLEDNGKKMVVRRNMEPLPELGEDDVVVIFARDKAEVDLITAAEPYQFDVVLTDNDLSKTDEGKNAGIKLINRLSESAANIPTVLTSGGFSEGDPIIAGLLSEGKIISFIRKPYGMTDIKNVLDALNAKVVASAAGYPEGKVNKVKEAISEYARQKGAITTKVNASDIGHIARRTRYIPQGEIKSIMTDWLGYSDVFDSDVLLFDPTVAAYNSKVSLIAANLQSAEEKGKPVILDCTVPGDAAAALRALLINGAVPLGVVVNTAEEAKNLRASGAVRYVISMEDYPSFEEAVSRLAEEINADVLPTLYTLQTGLPKSLTTKINVVVLQSGDIYAALVEMINTLGLTAQSQASQDYLERGLRVLANTIEQCL